MPELDLPNGYYVLPKGKLANVATFLEMREPPSRALAKFPDSLKLVKVDSADLTTYRDYFRRVGENLMWFSRVSMSDDGLRDILGHPDVLSFALIEGDEFCGLMELDLRTSPDCELSFFGLVSDKVGNGLGRSLMDEALRRAWTLPISRLFVHTCTFDHPAALPFYIRSGFTPVSVSVEIHDDPRLTGNLPLTASPNVPLIR